MVYKKGKIKNSTGDVILPLTTSDKVVNNTTEMVTVATTLETKVDKETSSNTKKSKLNFIIYKFFVIILITLTK